MFHLGSSVKDVRKNAVKINPPSPLSAFVRIRPYPPSPFPADVTKIAVNSDSWTDVRKWLLLALAGHSAGCRLSAGAIYLSIYDNLYSPA